ncbi:nSTAND1 domain-containing NTPase [Mycobacterium kubicae]|nr:pentapeptide repeat-containing protein [Mycobacterium kubicae]MCV7097491.1 pentapeptide repeat-containing protein [Mycobacterium kubicae]QPI36192.1 pentapeptide repeat-containing protein [Mycobacterium kubicae]
MTDLAQGANALHGRDADAHEFARRVQDHSVVVFTGASGVGKTSALYMAVRPQLERSGFAVMLCDTWNPPDDFDPATLIETQVSAQLPRGVRLGDEQPSLIEQLDRYYPDRAVVVLDQFEELIRYKPSAYQKLLEWIKETTETSRVRIVVSLRIEYEHELAGRAGLQIAPFQMTRYELAPITDAEIIEQIIRAATTSSGRPAASDEAVGHLVTAWEETVHSPGWSEVGLLHLQATLYSLWSTKTGHRIEGVDVQKMIRKSGATAFNASQPANVGLFEYGLSTSVEVALNHCREACLPAGIDTALATRTRELVVNMAAHLSSGGYKISLDRDELADRVVMGTSAPVAKAARSALASRVDSAGSADLDEDQRDWLAVRRSELLDSSRLHGGTWPWELDPEDSTGGALLGLRPVDSMLEELRSFHFALEWLRTCALIRMTSTEPGRVMVSLIHDRFAAGLSRWSETVRTGSEEAIARVSAIRGAILDWSSERHSESADHEMRTGSNRTRVIANVRWAYCTITKSFEKTTFVSCDFRGSTFHNCQFEGVSFVNCLLDDVEFVDCHIVGQPDALPADLTTEQKEKQPSFHVQAPQLVPILNRYRETNIAGSMLFSETAGLAAVPVPTGHTHARLVPFEPQLGGLTMFGGRLSSLKLRSCVFPQNGKLSLRHVAGTSVELAEQSEARLEVFAAALRGLTITIPIGMLTDPTAGVETTRPDNWFEVSVRDSRIINTWIGPGINGAAEFYNCRVWQLFNGSDSFSVTLPNSPVLGAVNVDESEDLIPVRIEAGTLGGIRDEVLEASLLIDYRSRPAKYEVTHEGERQPRPHLPAH